LGSAQQWGQWGAEVFALNHGDEVDRTVQELAYAAFSNGSTKALAVAANPLRVASRSRAAAGFDPKRTSKDGLALPPSQRSFAFQDFIAHPSLRGIVMRALVPHYVRLDRYPHW
jgi:hypothetical protein